MSAAIIDLHHWFHSPQGRYLLEWEQQCCDAAVADIFGYHALQLGMPLLQGLRANRMPHQWLALSDPRLLSDAQAHGASPAVALLAEPMALPFAEHSLDLLLLPHTLELSPDPHQVLREAGRVLMPEGRIVLTGLNPLSLWGLRQQRARLYQRLGGAGDLYLPDVGEFIGLWRLRDWLRLLGFDVQTVHFGCYQPAVRSARWLARHGWMDRLGARWWPILGAGYFVVAVKRVHGLRVLGPAWRSAPQAAAGAAPVVHHTMQKDKL